MSHAETYDQHGEAGRVRLGKAVLAEAADLLEHLLGELRRVALGQHAVDQLLAELSMIPGRRQAPIARRSWSASPGVKPAATTASCIACS